MHDKPLKQRTSNNAEQNCIVRLPVKSPPYTIMYIYIIPPHRSIQRFKLRSLDSSTPAWSQGCSRRWRWWTLGLGWCGWESLGGNLVQKRGNKMCPLRKGFGMVSFESEKQDITRPIFSLAPSKASFNGWLMRMLVKHALHIALVSRLQPVWSYWFLYGHSLEHGLGEGVFDYCKHGIGMYWGVWGTTVIPVTSPVRASQGWSQNPLIMTMLTPTGRKECGMRPVTIGSGIRGIQVCLTRLLLLNGASGNLTEKIPLWTVSPWIPILMENPSIHQSWMVNLWIPTLMDKHAPWLRDSGCNVI